MAGRSENSVRNVSTGIANKVLMMLLAFATRTLFIRLLGADYTGVSSLYSNILSVLSLAEMGMGNVLMFYLYSALKNQDTERIRALVNEFKKIYSAIIAIVLSIGLLLIPFLGYIVRSSLNRQDLVGYYLLYLINSVASYFVVYRTIVLSADQKNYISNIVHTIATIIMYILQFVYLLIFKDFWGYLIIQVAHTIGSNLVLNFISLKHYPYLKHLKKEKNSVSINKRELFGNIKATFLFKIADTILDQTDSIIISVLFGTVIVGFYSNYFILISYIVAIAGIIANGLVASFGNLQTEGNMQLSYEMFRVSLTAFTFFGTISTACYACIVQDFVPVWVGEKYLMPYSLVIAVLIVFYLRMITNTMWMYRSAMGLFKEVQYINLIATVLNIIFSIILGKLMDVTGVIVATAVSRVLSSFWYEGKIVYKRFNKPLSDYFLFQIKSVLVCLIVVSISIFMCSFVSGNPYLVILIKLLLALSISCVGLFIAYGRTKEFKTMLKKIKSVVRHKK